MIGQNLVEKVMAKKIDLLHDETKNGQKRREQRSSIIGRPEGCEV
jgi:hypothetical protein